MSTIEQFSYTGIFLRVAQRFRVKEQMKERTMCSEVHDTFLSQCYYKHEMEFVKELKNSCKIKGSLYIEVFNLILLMYLPVFMPGSVGFYYNNFWVGFKIKDDNTFRSVLLYRVIFSYPVFFFPHKDEYCFFKVCKKCLEF